MHVVAADWMVMRSGCMMMHRAARQVTIARTNARVARMCRESASDHESTTGAPMVGWNFHTDSHDSAWRPERTAAYGPGLTWGLATPFRPLE